MAYRREEFAVDEWYHCYTRSIDKKAVFETERDYERFLQALYICNGSRTIRRGAMYSPSHGRLLSLPRGNPLVSIGAYCLMPNHFHLLVKQNEARAIESFMRSLLIRYSTYFNRHYQRVGHVFQDVYKGVLVNQEGYFLWLSRYIHRNPLELLKNGERLSEYEYSSYPVYLGMRENEWVNSQEILGSIKDYKSFVEGPASLEPKDISAYTLES